MAAAAARGEHWLFVRTDPTATYALGSDAAESARLRRQSQELRPYAAELLDRIGLQAGQAAIDLGCGPSGILDLLSAAVAPGGRVVGLDADPAHVSMARNFAAEQHLPDVEIIAGDAGRTGLPAGSFDLVHARLLLVNLPDPAPIVAEMMRLARPGGWVAGQEADIAESLCYPPIPAWDRLTELFRASFSRNGADIRLGRRLAELYRQAGLTEIGVQAYSPVHPAGSSRRTILPDLVRSLRPAIGELGLASEAELDRLDREVREHLADPDVIEMSHLIFVVWGRKPR